MNPINQLRLLPTRLFGKASLSGVEVGQKPSLFGVPVISKAPNSRIRLGHRVMLCSDSYFTALGVHHAVVFRTLLPGAEIIIGNDVGISGGSICAAVRIEIGDGTMLGANVTIADTDFHPARSLNRRYAPLREAEHAPVKIGKNVFIGTNSIILKGVEIGDNAVVGAGSVVTRSVPANTIVGGNPAKPIGEI